MVEALQWTVALLAFNEQDNLEEAVREALSALPQFLDDFEILIINDGSHDRTGEIADSLARNPHVRVIHHPINRGFAGAMNSAVAAASGRFLVISPADGQARFDDLQRLTAACSDNEFVFSYRIHRHDSVYRKLSSRIWYLYLRLVFREAIKQFSSLFVFSTAAIREMDLSVRPDGANFLPYVYFQAVRQKRRVAWIGTVQYTRRGGKTKGASLRLALRTVTEDLVLARRLRRSTCPDSRPS